MTNLLWRKKNCTLPNGRVGKKNSNNTLNNFSVVGIVLNRFIDVGRRETRMMRLHIIIIIIIIGGNSSSSGSGSSISST